MFRFKNWIKNLFGFTRAQVNGSLVLLVIMAVALFSEPFWRLWVQGQPTDFSADAIFLDSLIAHWPQDPRPIFPADTAKEPRKRFKFNPNLASMEELVSLGFLPSMAQRVIRYREKGGTFRVKSDLLKIYGLDSSFYNQLDNLLELPDELPGHARPLVRHKTAAPNKIVKVSPIKSFDLNSADTAQLKEIQGIGDKLSLRIVKYRDVLGGFTSADQLREVYGLDSAVIQRLQTQTFIDKDFIPLQINLNTSSEAEILKHPYLSKSARSIVSYRFQHGPFAKVEDIRNVGSLDEEQVKKIMPYITVK